MEMKKCPFCGEMIMATARKCRYCGSWLDGREELPTTMASKDGDKEADETLSEVEAETTDEEEETTNWSECVPYDKAAIMFLYVIGIIGALILECNDLPTSLRGHGGKVGFIIGILSIIQLLPTWLGIIMDTIGTCGLVYAIDKTLSNYGKPMSAWLITFILLYCASCGIQLIEGEDTSTFGLFILLGCILMQMAVGIKMMVSYKEDNIKELGIVLTFLPVVYLIAFVIITVLNGEDGRWGAWILPIVSFVYYLMLYNALNNTLLPDD